MKNGYTKEDLAQQRRDYEANYEDIHNFVETTKQYLFDTGFVNGTPAFQRLNKALRLSPVYQTMMMEERRLDKLGIEINEYLNKPEGDEDD